MRFGVVVLSLLSVINIHAQTVPDFSITDTEGTTWQLYEQLAGGKTVILDFFFVDCTPCQTLTPMMEAVFQDYGGEDGNLLVLGISDRDEDFRISDFAATYGSSYPSGGIEGGGDSITSLYQGFFPFVGWPTYAVICPDTTIRWDLPHTNNLPELRSAIDSCLSPILGTNLQPQARPNAYVYPNPSHGTLLVSGDLSGFEYLSVIDLKGKLRKKVCIPPSDSAFLLSLYDIPSGFYILHLTGDQSTSIKHLVIQTH